MNPSPLEYAESLHIGTVEFVSPNEVKVCLDIEAPESVALNTGTPRPFPRINGYVLIPNDDGYLVGQVEWLTIEQSTYPKRRGMMDFGLVDLPYPLRKLKLNPVGTLRKKVGHDGNETYSFKQGVESFPSVGDNVLIPTQVQLRSIVDSGANRRVKIGTSALAGNADVFIDPDRLFGRHLAILGNTGSGKSCSVAGLIRWSLEAAQKEKGDPNARFIVLDPNGEYERAFGSETGILKPRIFKVDPKPGMSQLQVPVWFWDSSEWSSFTQASGKTQRPLLRRALREVKAGRVGIQENSVEERKLSLRRYISSKVISTRRDFKSGAIHSDESKFGFRLKAMNADLVKKAEEFPELKANFDEIKGNIDGALAATYNSFETGGKVVEYFRAFTEQSVEKIINSMVKILDSLGGIIYEEGPSEDMPISFLGTDLCDHLSILSEEENATQFLDFLIMRIRTLLSDTRMKSIISDIEPVALDNWLTDYIGGNQAKNGCLTIIDLSLVPSEIVHIVTAVIARIVFESLQRYTKVDENHKVLPTVLVMEEAHTFVRRYKDDVENEDAAAICCKVFERIAREGRKFGLGLVLSSQRPSELSPTVLSQCNTFLLHRISNDSDQDLVHRYVPDNLRGLLRDLPILPSQNAILLGWASELPVIVRMNDLPKEQQPQSDDPDFWKVWTGEDPRDVDWKNIVDIWQGKTDQQQKPQEPASKSKRRGSMEFRIADTFVDSLAKLNNEDQKAIKTTVFDLQVNPASSGLGFHKLDRAQDPNFASVRVSSDLRLIVHHGKGSLLICYVAHHDAAYAWAERRKLETHPKTGAAQLVEIRETIQEIIIPTYVTEQRPKPRLFAKISDDELLGYGVPPEWLADVRLATEDTYLELSDHLPAEAAEALLELSVGGTPQTTQLPAPIADPFDHPDAMRRFRLMADVEELERALAAPWEKWIVFMHPEQRRFATGNHNGPARVSGSAGTGKTVVALHRAVHLAKTNPSSRVLLATFSDTLANTLKTKLRILIHNQPHLGEQIEVYAMNAIGERLYAANIGKVRIASPETIQALLDEAVAKVSGHSFSRHFLTTEWEQVVDAWQLDSWEAYRDVSRLGRKTRLTETHRRTLWAIFEQVQSALRELDLVTYAGLFSRLTTHYAAGQRPPFDFIVVDEAQDVNIPQLKLLAALSGNRPNSLFFAGDLGQRIFQQPFSWKSLGVDVRGRSKTLHINYRTSHQIRRQADKLLGPELADVDGNTETRRDTISVFNGPAPTIETFDTPENESEAVAVWLKERLDNGIQPEEIGVFVRSDAQLPRAKAAFDAAGLAYKVLDWNVETTVGSASLCTMHLAKGLEFRAVAVMACDDEIVPLQERIETVTDASDLEEVYNTERHLLYVACTRARDHLLVTSVEPASEFLEDMRM